VEHEVRRIHEQLLEDDDRSQRGDAARHGSTGGDRRSTYPKPRTVYRPFFDVIPPQQPQVGQPISFVVNARSPLDGATLRYSASELPSGARFDPATRAFRWTPGAAQAGTHTVRFTVDDGVLPEHRDIALTVAGRSPR
jgi:hypothetical protein